MDYDAIRAAIKTRLEAVSSPMSFVTVYDHVPDFITPPCAIVVPANNVVTYHEAMGAVSSALHTLRFDIVVAAQRFESNANQETLNDYIVTVPTALEADQTLGGLSSAVLVTNARNYGPLSFADSVFLGVQFDLECIA